MARYGQKGGDGPTAGRRAEIIEADICGAVVRKRVFFGQRWISFLQKEAASEPLVQAWHSKEEAQQYVDSADNIRWPVQIVVAARPLTARAS